MHVVMIGCEYAKEASSATGENTLNPDLMQVHAILNGATAPRILREPKRTA